MSGTLPGLKMTRMPRTYEPPMGTPLYWMSEQSGELAAAIKSYLFHGAEPDRLRRVPHHQHPEPTTDQLVLVIDYCRYVIFAPCWRGDDVKRLRERIKSITTADQLQRWIGDCLEIGIDPL